MPANAFILLVDEDTADAEPARNALRERGYAVRIVGDATEALESVKLRPPDVVVTEFKLPGAMNGLELLRAVRRESPSTQVIVLTGFGDEQLARTVLRRDAPGAFDYFTKPADLEDLCDAVDRASQAAVASRGAEQLRATREAATEFDGILATSEAMNQVIRKARRVANSKITVLIEGESGTGKDLLARAIHAHSDRRNRPFHAVNCAGFNEGTLESELFGHVRGSFTGAERDRKGIFEHCDGGTLFLDEIGDMPLGMQAKLLRVLGNGEIVPVGSNEVRKVDVRLVAATHRDLPQLIAEGKFRSDLFYRLCEVRLKMPALRDRREDIAALVERFIRQANQAHGRSIQGITPDAMRKLIAAPWRGNVRELQATIAGMVVLAEGEMLDVYDLPEELQGTTDIVPAGQARLAGIPLEALEREAIRATLAMVDGNREQAAKLLGIGPRTIYRKLKEYNLQ